MPSPNILAEFREAWLPHVTDAGLLRLTELLRQASPLLIHGMFTSAVPMGCLATQIGWHHPDTAHCQHDAGIYWLARVARLNPATSAVIVAWDQRGVHDWALRAALLDACEAEATERAAVREPAFAFAECC